MKPISRLLSFLLIIILLNSCSFVNRKPDLRGESSLVDPATGLDTLSKYKVDYSLKFEGTFKGNPSDWTTNYTMMVDKDPQTRLMTYTQSGLDSFSPYQELEGFMGGIYYSRATTESPCMASFSDPEMDPLVELPELAGKLPKINKMTSSGTGEIISGIETQLYTFDASGLNSRSGADVDGKLWLAKEGNYLVKFEMSLAGDNNIFDADTSGTFTWNYQLQPLESSSSILPADCPLPLPELPSVKNSTNLLVFPGYMTFETNMTPDEVLSFYQQNLPSSQFSLVDDIRTGSEVASMVYSDGTQNINFSVIKGNPTRVNISGQSQQQLAAITPQPTIDLSAQSTQIYASPQMRVINSLGLLIGQDPEPSVFSSYHMESHQLSPRWDEQTGSVIVPENWLNVDVQGKNIHFINTDKSVDGTLSPSEVYLTGDKEYIMQNGLPTEGLGLASLTWIMWPLDPLMLLGIGSSKADPGGTEILDGRSTEIYQLSGTTADDLTGLYSGLGFLVTSMDGKVWVDSQTGALLKARINYDADIKDSNSTIQDSRSGLLELTVTQVNTVTVNLP